MKKVMMMTVVAAALGLSGCATESQKASAPAAKKASAPAAKKASAPAAKKASKPHIQAVFKKGSKVCDWTGKDGSKGTDYFYKDVGALKGSADRVMGDKMKQGTWQITGSAINLNWYGGKKGKGVWFKSTKTGKKSFDLTSFSGEKYSMKCK
ncbi:MAG: hypothetical protein HOK54_19590 [Alphaproteobacteria bacterium]|nr:hypothetical protein [Alphaproteobacteria bacterium]